jgi:hypothetical protein
MPLSTGEVGRDHVEVAAWGATGRVRVNAAMLRDKERLDRAAELAEAATRIRDRALAT